MAKSLLDLSADDKFDHCQKLINSISQRLVNAIHLSEMCETVIFSDKLSKQIPNSYAGHHYALLQRTLFKQLSLNLCTLWDIFDRDKYEDRVSFPTIVSLINDDVIQLAEKRSYQHWHDDVKLDLLGSY